MRKIILIALLLCVNENVFGQWLQLSFPVASDLKSVAFCNADTGFVVTNNNIYRTIDGGENWIISATAPYQLYDICVPNFNKNGGVATSVGGFLNFDLSGNQEVHNTILRTTNYGESWTTTTDIAGIGASRLEYCYLINDSVGFVMGSCGPYLANNSFKKTTNRGQSWSIMTGLSVVIYTGNNVDFINDTVGYASGNGGGVARTTNQGNNWTFLIFSEGSRVSFESNTRGYWVSSGVKSTTNSGQNWIQTSDSGISRNNEDLPDIKFPDSLLGYVVGIDGKIFKTGNGFNWTQQASSTFSFLNKISSIDKDYLYISGNSGTILKTTNGGMLSSTSDSPTLATEFRLEQNYPNPFNPTTTVKFSLASTSQVSLIIYDILGRQVMELVNEKKPAGNHSVKFDASRLSSGIYFYRLVTSSFSQTRKMILVK